MTYGEKTWQDIETLTDRIVIVPLGSLEQHGHHLPLLTDSIICQELVNRAALELGDEVLFMPLLWLGASHHHRNFPGTLSLNNSLYTQVLEDMLEGLIDTGFRKIVFLNAHGGNEAPGRQALYEVQRRHGDKRDLWIVFASWMVLASEQIASLAELMQKHVTHASELETSMILKLNPQLVKMDKAKGFNSSFESAFYSADYSRPSRVGVVLPFDQSSDTGAFGHPENATAEKGEALFKVATQEIVSFVREFAGWPERELSRSQATSSSG